MIFPGSFGIVLITGVWRSLVARTAGGREVAGSNPVAPSLIDEKDTGIMSVSFFSCVETLVFYKRRCAAEAA